MRGKSCAYKRKTARYFTTLTAQGSTGVEALLGNGVASAVALTLEDAQSWQDIVQPFTETDAAGESDDKTGSDAASGVSSSDSSDEASASASNDDKSDSNTSNNTTASNEDTN